MSEATEQIINSKIFTEWHWLRYHFQGLPKGQHTFFSIDFLNKLSLIELKIPGFTKEMISRLASYSGKEKYEPHYEQLIQLLAEIVIFYRLSEGFLASDTKFQWEPKTPLSEKNPELLIHDGASSTLIEIKCPSILNHLRDSAQNDLQLGARIGNPATFDNMATSGKATRPLDNKIKDFLVSAESKFKPFKKDDENISSILIIAWSQYLFEATAPLINGMSGLLTENSFFKDDSDNPVKYPSVDAIIVTEHLELVLRATREEKIPHNYISPLDYGNFAMPGSVPPALIYNPNRNTQPNEKVLRELKVVNIEDMKDIGDPRVLPMEFVHWF